MLSLNANTSSMELFWAAITFPQKKVVAHSASTNFAAHFNNMICNANKSKEKYNKKRDPDRIENATELFGDQLIISAAVSYKNVCVYWTLQGRRYYRPPYLFTLDLLMATVTFCLPQTNERKVNIERSYLLCFQNK